MIKLSIFDKLGKFNKSTKLSKDFGVLNDRLIIQYFHRIHIRTLTYTMHSLNFSTLKNIIYFFSIHTKIWNIHESKRKVINIFI